MTSKLRKAAGQQTGGEAAGLRKGVSGMRIAQIQSHVYSDKMKNLEQLDRTAGGAGLAEAGPGHAGGDVLLPL